MGEMMADAGREVRITIPLEISVRLGPSAAVRGAEAPVAVDKTTNATTDTATAKPATEAAADPIGAHGARVSARASTATAAPGKPQRIRNRAALEEGPLTFRDRFISLYQSAVAEVAKEIAKNKKAAATHFEATNDEAATNDASDLILAAEKIAQLHADGRSFLLPPAGAREAESSLEKVSTIERAGTCAALGWELMKAKFSGDEVTAKDVEDQLDAGNCDPRWARTITEYLKYFGSPGSPKLPMYVTPAAAGEKVITIKAGAKVALIGDWGTGAGPALRVLQQIKQQNPDILIHLGDIYYSGTDDECRTKFEGPVNEIFDRARTKLPVYSLAGNHDMYCGGVGYYALIKRLNKGIKSVDENSMVQPASFFCLRAEDSSWQLLAMDTGRYDHSPFSVTNVTTFVESSEQDWLRERIAEFRGKTILLSHHQLFSAFSQIGGRSQSGKLDPVNQKLLGTYRALAGTGKPVVAWFWGHEHNLCIYEPYSGLARGRCLGHGAVPVFSDDTPYDSLTEIDNPPTLVANSKLSTEGQLYTHGFAVLSLDANAATAEYFEYLHGGPRKVYTEVIT
jgi:hypothetical protein